LDRECTFEEALSRLESIVRDLEDGQLTLEQALDKFKEGIELSKFCHRQLNRAEEKVMLLTVDMNGEFHVEEVD
jgi:exodeoxyribonuclease VII small subunit